MKSGTRDEGNLRFSAGKQKNKPKTTREKNLRSFEICLEMHANEIDALYDRHQKVSPSPNPHHKASNSAKHKSYGNHNLLCVI